MGTLILLREGQLSQRPCQASDAVRDAQQLMPGEGLQSLCLYTDSSGSHYIILREPGGGIRLVDASAPGAGRPPST